MAARLAKMRVHKCRFEDSTEAASHNGKWLRHYKWDLTNAITKQKGTMMDPESEFRNEGILRELWENGVHWPKMQ